MIVNKPKKKKTITEWLESPGLILPNNTAEPGKINIARTPYMFDILDKMSPENPTKEVILVFGSQMGKTKDTLVRDVIAAGTNVIYAGGKTRKTMTNNDKFSIALVKQAVRKLKRQNAPKIGDSYVAIVHPDTVYDLWNDPEWVEAQKYNNAEKIYNGAFWTFSKAEMMQ